LIYCDLLFLFAPTKKADWKLSVLHKNKEAMLFHANKVLLRFSLVVAGCWTALACIDVSRNEDSVNRFNTDFFVEYDMLAKNAKQESQVLSEFATAYFRMKETQKELERIPMKIKNNHREHQKQSRRNRRASKHENILIRGFLFAAHPQWWFRGGFKGKIRRAKQIQEHLRDQYIDLRWKKQNVNAKLAKLEVEYKRHLDSVASVTSAISRTKKMFGDAIAEFQTLDLITMEANLATCGPGGGDSAPKTQQQGIDELEEKIEAEKNRIFDELRARAVSNSAVVIDSAETE
jgi:hypothetical protein